MSAEEMNFSAEEITERFVRGDLARNTEGSGLGLAIAQSFTELQNGKFKVEIDGDLFKVILSWSKNN
jgi:signal transduction histidine kinase